MPKQRPDKFVVVVEGYKQVCNYENSYVYTKNGPNRMRRWHAKRAELQIPTNIRVRWRINNKR